MPTPGPTGGGSDGFWSRVKQRLVDELGLGGGGRSAPGVVPVEPQPEEQLSPSLLTRFRDRLKNVRPRTPAREEPPLGRDRILFRIREAGKNGVLLFMRYHNTWRHVEPYSFRPRGKGGALRFFGFCRLHGHIEQYIPEKIEEIIVTDERFAPRWPVELA